MAIAQDRHPESIACFQIGIVIDEHAVELGQPGFGQNRERFVTQQAMIALEQDAGHAEAFVRRQQGA